MNKKIKSIRGHIVWVKHRVNFKSRLLLTVKKFKSTLKVWTMSWSRPKTTATHTHTHTNIGTRSYNTFFACPRVNPYPQLPTIWHRIVLTIIAANMYSRSGLVQLIKRSARITFRRYCRAIIKLSCTRLLQQRSCASRLLGRTATIQYIQCVQMQLYVTFTYQKNRLSGVRAR